MNKILKAITNPGKAFNFAVVLIRSAWYRLLYVHILRRATIGKDFKVMGKLSIKGPGKVIIGDSVRIGMTVTPWTYHPDAVIEIGDRTFLNGTRFACERRIYIGNDVICADCRIMDTDFHGTHPDHRDEHKAKAIHISSKVWITIQCVILKGANIGQGSTITPNSVVLSNIPPNEVWGGNPAQHIRKAK